jgi:hypothetical protein
MKNGNLVPVLCTLTLCMLVILTHDRGYASAGSQMTFHNLSNDFAMIKLSGGKENCIVQPHQNCTFNTVPQFYTVNVCVTYCSVDKPFLYAEYGVYGTCDVFLNQTSPVNFTVTNSCPEYYKENPKPQSLVLITPSEKQNSSSSSNITTSPPCGT